MIRIILAMVIMGHGLINLLGFIKNWKLAAVEQLTGRTLLPLSPFALKAVGLLWLLACGLFLIIAVLLLMKKEWWWALALFAILISQALIVLFWQDAKFGTWANAIILIGAVLAYGTWSFGTMVDGELKLFTQTITPPKEIVTEPMLINIPKPVQKWLRRSGILGKEVIHSVQLKQSGVMRTSLEGSWLPVKAEQQFNVDMPGFIWVADVKAAPFLHLHGRDKFINAQGHMLIKLFSLYPVVDSKGDAIDQGTMLRFLAESVWFPTFALSSYVTWEEIDEQSAKCTMLYNGKAVLGVFSFNGDGDIKSFYAKRYYDRKEGATLEDWLVEIDQGSFKTYDGIKVPTSAKITWKLKSGDFTWYNMSISDVVFNYKE